MITFDAHNFVHMVGNLRHFQQKAEAQDFFLMSDDDRAAYISWVENTDFLGAMYELDIADSVSRLLKVLQGDRNVITSVPNLILELRHRISDELAKHEFMYIPDEYAPYYEQQKLFGNEVYQSFPSARGDIKDAGNCYASGNWTATVFHLMRVLERGLRALAKALRLKFPTKPTTVVELKEWRDIIVEIEKKVKDIENKKKTRKREADAQFYDGAAAQFRYFKNGWRNHVMHARKTYDKEDARIVMRHTDEFMQHLATRLKE